MPRIEATAEINCSINAAFALSQTFGLVRRQWDPFVIEETLLDGATEQGKNVKTYSRSKYALKMISECISFKPPTHIGMKMVKGPWFFSSFSGGWNFVEISENEISATWRYNFICKPKMFHFIMHPVGKIILNQDIKKRLSAFKKACENKNILDIVNIGTIELSLAKESISDDKHLAGKNALAKSIFSSSSLTSISHGKKTAYAVSARETDGVIGIGIDFEEVKPLKTRALKFFLNQNEIDNFDLIEDREKIKMWTIKEAVFKATPNNKDLVLRDFEITKLDAMTGNAKLLKAENYIYEFVSREENSGVVTIAICKKL